MTRVSIQLEHVNFWYDHGKPSEMLALKDISLSINEGDYVAFFGPSGSGKTSLLYLLSGVEQCQAGKIFINGKDIGTMSRQELAIYRQVGVGMVFQQFNLIPSLTVLDNIILPMSFLGVSPVRAKVEALKLLERLDITKLADRMPFELSGGQQQRVGIARALANNPPIIIADEPLGNLDSSNAQRVIEILRELNEKDKRTIIMVTHEAWSLRDAKRIFYIKDGVVLKEEEQKNHSLAETLSKQLYEDLNPQKSPEQLASHTLSNLLLRGYSPEEVTRFDGFLSQRLQGQIDSETFRIQIDKSFKEGGVGLWTQTALKISKYVEDILVRRHELEDLYEQLEKNPEASLQSEVEKIRMWVLEGQLGKISGLQIEQLDEIITEAIRKVIDKDTFKKILNLPKSKYGIGFSMRKSSAIAEKMELAFAGKIVEA